MAPGSRGHGWTHWRPRLLPRSPRHLRTQLRSSSTDDAAANLAAHPALAKTAGRTPVTRTTTHRIPMHRDGHVVTLEEVLEAVDGAGLEWHLTHFDAIPKTDAGLDTDFLEREAKSRPGGLVFSDTGLRDLAAKLQQVIDCDILGYPEGQPADAQVAAALSIVAFDSGEWAVHTSEGHGHRFLGRARR